MTENSIGGEDSRFFFLVVFILGVLVGSFVRVGAFVMPSRLVRFCMEKLLPGGAPE
jgi:hypothetical protein